MPAALSMRERRLIVRLREEGQSYRAIATELNRNYHTVRNIYRHYEETGQLAPAYDKCSHTKIRGNEEIYERAVALKDSHPTWGAGLIWSELARDFEEADLPSERTLQRWFKRAGVQRPPAERSARVYAQRGKRSHDVWAIDAKERIELADGSQVSWFTVTDEGSGAILSVHLFPHQALDTGRSLESEKRSARDDAILGASRTDTNG